MWCRHKARVGQNQLCEQRVHRPIINVLECDTACCDCSAERTLPSIPKEHHNKLAHFLEGQDFKKLALDVSSDPEHKFELALQLKELHLAREVRM